MRGAVAAAHLHQGAPAVGHDGREECGSVSAKPEIDRDSVRRRGVESNCVDGIEGRVVDDDPPVGRAHGDQPRGGSTRSDEQREYLEGAKGVAIPFVGGPRQGR